jgi:hypothetical protein
VGSQCALMTLQTEGQIKKFNQRRQLVQVVLFTLMALGAGSAFATQSTLTAIATPASWTCP